jgi:hypothetical protein
MSINISIKTIQRPFDLSSIEVNAPFACLLHSSQEDLSNDELMLIANWLVSSGCKEVICAGLRCSEWHNVIEAASTIQDPSTQILIKTTLNENEAIEDVIWVWMDIANYENTTSQNILALLIGGSIAMKAKALTGFTNYPFSSETKLILKETNK